MSRLPLLIIVAFALLLIPLPARPAAGQDAPDELAIQAVDFVEPFDGNPTSPQPFVSPRWETVYHLRDEGRANPSAVLNVAAQHGPDCAGPPATHQANTLGGMVFNCRDHMMTSIDGGQYGAIYLQPDAIVDFTNGEAVVRWDVSTARTAGRDVWDMTITPFPEQLQMPLQGFFPDLQGMPRNAVQVALPIGNEGHASASGFEVNVIRNGQESNIGNTGLAYESFLAPSASRRDTFELRISRTRISFCMPAYGRCWADQSISALGWSRGVVQFGHHSYNPFKDGGVPNSWHWDNVSISPSLPMTLIKTNRHSASGPGDVVTLNSPAPAGSWLRFNAWGRVEVSIDGGPYALARRQPSTLSGGTYHPENAGSYFHPLPTGARTFTMRFSADSWYDNQKHAQSFGVWAETAPPVGPTPTLAPTLTPLPTVANTATAIAAATATAAPGATATTAAATATAAAPTPSPVATVPPGDTGHIRWRGQDAYLHGANLPWFNWACDFGCNVNGGVRATSATIAAKLRQARQAGLVNIRWWVFEADEASRPWQITTDAAGIPIGIDPSALADMDRAIELARQEDVVYHFVLFASSTRIPRSWLTNAAQRDGLALVLGRDLFARYANEPRVMTWEVMNEPEFGIRDSGVNTGQVQAFVRAIVAAKHANAPLTHVTVGAAHLSDLPLWRGLGLTYYQAHWYDNVGQFTPDDAEHRTYDDVAQQYGLDLPLVIGEWYNPGHPDRWERLKANGYAGAWPWSLFNDRTSDGFTVDYPSATAFTTAHSDVGPMLTNPPPPTATAVAATATAEAATATAVATATAAAATSTASVPTPVPDGRSCRVQFRDASNVWRLLYAGTIVNGSCVAAP